jgi:enoyl-CoA hydratase/carnithine racemase
MPYEAIEFDVEDEIAIIRLNRPERMNAWNDAMGNDLREAMRRCDGDPGIRAVVLTGNGRAFCAGADLGGGGKTFGDFSKRREEQPKPSREDTEAGYAGPFPWQISKPVFAAINGHAIGVGITYPMTCDVRIVAEDAKIQFAFTRRGILPELWSHAIVPRVAGLSRASDLLLTGRMVRGREFADLGLANEALPADQVLPATLERAKEIRNAAPVSVAISKRLIWDGLTTSLPELGRRESKLFGWTSQQPDAKEGVVSFLEKRAPEWKLDPAKDMPEI